MTELEQVVKEICESVDSITNRIEISIQEETELYRELEIRLKSMQLI